MKKVLLSAILFTSLFINAQAPAFAWAKSMGSTGSNYGTSVTTDAFGNVYTTGYFQGTTDFDPGAGTYTITSGGSLDIFISKLDAAGNFVWAKSMGGTNGDYGTSIATDASGNVYTTGYFQGAIDLDPGAGTYTLASAGSDDIFVSKLDAAGNFVWAKNIGGVNGDNGNSIAVDASGNVYTTGAFRSTVDFDPGAGTYTLLAAGSVDIFVSKLDAAGNFVWAKNMGGAVGDYGNSITIDASGNVYTTGNFMGIADFDPGAGTYTITSMGGLDIFISKLDAAGSFVWAKSIGSTGNDNSASIATDASGNVYTTGFFSGTTDFDPGAGTYTLALVGGTDIYVSKLDAAGNFVWVKSIGGTLTDYGTSIAIDASGDVYTTGYFESNVDFDPGTGIYTLTAAGVSNIFISKLDVAGNFVWGSNIGGSGTDYGASIDVDAPGSVYTTGYFQGTVDFDPGAGTYTLTAAGGVGIFIHKMSQCLVPSLPLNTTPVANKLICNKQTTTLTATGSGTVTWYANPSGTLSLATGTVYATPTLTTGIYTYYVEATTCTVSAGRTAITVTVSACTGILLLNDPAQEISVYPNPFDQKIIVVSNGTREIISVYNSMGVVIYSAQSIEKMGDAIEIDLSSQPAGIYFIRSGLVCKKIIKE